MTQPATAPRTPTHAIDDLFHARWSPRAFPGEEFPEATILGLFEAAREAPSDRKPLSELVLEGSFGPQIHEGWRTP
jgi:nitroreductase